MIAASGRRRLAGCRIVFGALAMLAAIPSQAQSVSSYTLSTSTRDQGGGNSHSAHYSATSSLGDMSSAFPPASISAISRQGFTGQLYEVTGLTLATNSAPVSVEGGGLLALRAWQVLDDATYLRVPANAIDWSVISGPLGGISPDGFVSGVPVAVDSPAIVQAIVAGEVATLAVEVKAQGTLPTTVIGTNGAILKGSIDPNGQPTTVWFEYGTDAAYGQSTAQQSLGNGTGSVQFDTTLAGLLPNSIFHYRLMVTRNSVTTAYADQTFSTSIAVPALPRWALIALPMLLITLVSRHLWSAVTCHRYGLARSAGQDLA